jgi:hypothetical protein
MNSKLLFAMKKSVLLWSFIILAVIPACLVAQEIQLPTAEIRANQDYIPAKVKAALQHDFGAGHKPVAWVSSNTSFNATEWAQLNDVYSFDITTYSLHGRTGNGSTLDAYYTSTGKLINSREYLKNFRPSREIMLALQKSDYRNWGISKDFHLIKCSSSGAPTEHLGLVLKNGKEKKTVYFDQNNHILAVEPGDHGELADLDR